MSCCISQDVFEVWFAGRLEVWSGIWQKVAIFFTWINFQVQIADKSEKWKTSWCSLILLFLSRQMRIINLLDSSGKLETSAVLQIKMSDTIRNDDVFRRLCWLPGSAPAADKVRLAQAGRCRVILTQKTCLERSSVLNCGTDLLNDLRWHLRN